TVWDHARQALELLSANGDEYDIKITDVNMSDMDEFQLLENVQHEINLPVIMISVDSKFEVVMNAINYGAVDYLVKPVRLEELKLIWRTSERRAKVVKISPSEVRDAVAAEATSEDGAKQDVFFRMMPDGFPAVLRVLAIDDDSAVLETLKLMLLKCGYT
ncbi:two-component response regulator ARR11-like, partial [Phalaenopsis equestris]|uniref:two-component response regulator ARR11-like n=1 Tax=Phalaenopsis equestris TaxID=78828 RepID=UPI0009E63196